MRLFAGRRGYFVLGVAIAVVCYTAGAAAADIMIPCPKWAVGDSWETRSFFKNNVEGPASFEQTTTVSSVVKSRDERKIVVAEKTVVQAIYVNPRVHQKDPPPQIMSAEMMYEVLDEGIVLRQKIGTPLTMVYDPPVPICGALPETVTFRVKASIMGNNVVSGGSTSYQVLGREKVTVPAGTFDAVVFDAEQGRDTNQPNLSSSPSPLTVIRSYVADGVGVVKTEIISTRTRRVRSPSGNAKPDVEAVFQEGLEEMAKGGDPTAALKKLDTIKNETEVGPPKFEEVQSKNITELVVYRSAE